MANASSDTTSIELPACNTVKKYVGHFEIVSLVGTVDQDGQHHLHISISDAEGNVFGGHVYEKHIIYTTGKLKLKLKIYRKNVPFYQIFHYEKLPIFIKV